METVFALELRLVDYFEGVALLGRGVSDEAHFSIRAFAENSGFGSREGEVGELERGRG